MRIITGKYRGRIIIMPKGIRPTQNKVRKALFDILGDIEGLSFLELFAGSGAIGFEALSRGVKELALVEQAQTCLQAIKSNIESLKLESCTVYPQGADRAIEQFCRNKKKFDIIFLDPPYYQEISPRLRPSLRSGLEDGSEQSEESRSGSKISLENWSLSKKTLQILGAYDILSPYGFVIVQHFKRDELSKEAKELILFKEARYADTVLSFYKKKEA